MSARDSATQAIAAIQKAGECRVPVQPFRERGGQQRQISDSADCINILFTEFRPENTRKPV